MLLMLKIFIIFSLFFSISASLAFAEEPSEGWERLANMPEPRSESNAIAHNNKIYVVKENNDCIVIYDLNGNLIHEFGSKGKEIGEFDSPQNIEIFEVRGEIYMNKDDFLNLNNKRKKNKRSSI